MTPQELQAIKDRWEKATPGPWTRNTYFPNNPTTEILHIDSDGNSRRVAKALYHLGSEDPEVMSNATAIASAPTDIADLLAEIERLTSCLKFEQNYLSRVGTHADGCYKWGPGHWDCAVQEIERLQAENEGLKIPKQHSCNNCKNNYRSVDDKDCAYCINSFALPNWEGLK